MDDALRTHLANEERLLAGLSGRDRADLTRLLRKFPLSKAFTALDPKHATDHVAQVVTKTSRARRRR